jgi:4'-phosphopantetheinyl transferase
MAEIMDKEIGNKGRLAIWHISESLDELLKMKNLSTDDLKRLNSFSYEGRKKEWLVARILAEKLTSEKNTQIIYNECNKPFLQNSKTHISISHSHHLLAVILDEAETGIDIELIKDKILNIREKFMSKTEFDSLQKKNVAEQLTVYWCAKEALYKLYGKRELIFKENLLIEPFQYSGNGILRGWIKNATMNKCFLLKYENLKWMNKTYMLTYIIKED